MKHLIALLFCFIAMFLPALSNASSDSAYFYDASNKVFSTSDFLGKPLVLFAYKKDCAICLRMLSSLDKFKSSNPSNFNIIAVMVSSPSLGDARQIFIRQDIRFLPIYLDLDNTLLSALDFHVTPMTILFNSSGKMVKKIQGPVTWTGPFFQEEIKELTKLPE